MKTIALPEDTYYLLKDLKFELRKDTLREVVADLIREHRQKQEAIG